MSPLHATSAKFSQLLSLSLEIPSGKASRFTTPFATTHFHYQLIKEENNELR
jgi:hypothetical protein